MSAARATGQLRTAPQTSSAFKAQQPRARSAAPPPEDGTAREGARQALAQSLGNQWRRTPTGSGAGPTGERYEHWHAMSSEETLGTHVARVLAALAVGDAPAEAMQMFFALPFDGNTEERWHSDAHPGMRGCGPAVGGTNSLPRLPGTDQRGGRATAVRSGSQGRDRAAAQGAQRACCEAPRPLLRILGCGQRFS